MYNGKNINLLTEMTNLVLYHELYVPFSYHIFVNVRMTIFSSLSKKPEEERDKKLVYTIYYNIS